MRLELQVSTTCANTLREKIALNNKSSLSVFLLTFQAQVTVPDPKPRQQPTMDTVQKTAAAAQAAMTAAKLAEKACIEATTSQNIENISNNLHAMNVERNDY